MDISSVGPTTLDPFTPSPGPALDDAPEASPTTPTPSAPLAEGTGTVIDTSA